MTQIARSIRIAAKVCAVLVLAVNVSAAQESAERIKQNDDIREAVLRYQMNAWASDADKIERDAKSVSDAAIAKQLNSRVFFISVDGKDPSIGSTSRADRPD